MKKGIYKYIYLGILIVMLFSFSGCFKRYIEIKDLKYFKYSYSVGYYKDASVSYEIEYKDDKYYFYFKDKGIPEENKKTYTLSEDNIKELIDIFNKHKINKWDGFEKSNKNIMDGNSFTLKIKYNSDKDVYAHGYMVYPSNYREVKTDIENFFNKFIK